VRIRKILGAALLALCSTYANAISIPLPGGSPIFWAENRSGAIGWEYDPITETLTTASQWTGPFAKLFAEGNLNPLINAEDVTAQYFVSAHVDHTGSVLGGTYAFLASSPTLGLNGIQPILTGLILGSTGGDEQNPFDDDNLVGSVDFFNPLLAQLTVTPEVALLTAHFCFCVNPQSSVNPWEHHTTFGTLQPDIISSHNSVPEPSTAILLAIALLGLPLVRWRWNPKLLARA
jgi:hypothetical protein